MTITSSSDASDAPSGSTIVDNAGASSVSGGIATVPAAAVATPGPPINPATGEPLRPWPVRLASFGLWLAAMGSGVGLLASMWLAISDFPNAARLFGFLGTDTSPLPRVGLAALATLIGIIVCGTTSVVGYYSWRGYAWTRVGGIVAAAVSLLTLFLQPWTALAIVPALVGAALLWLPSVPPFFQAWARVRRGEPTYGAPIDAVFYGPVPRYADPLT